MKNISIKTLALLLVSLILTISCTKTGPTGANGATGPAGGPIMTGNIEGLINLYDVGNVKQYGATFNTGDSIILTNNSNGIVYKTTTSSTGNYTFTGVPSGTYSFTASKYGYGSVKSFGFQFVGGGTAYKNFNLSQLPNNNISTLSYLTSGSSSNLSGTVPTNTATSTSQIIIFVSKPSQTFANGTFGNYSTYYSTSISSLSTSFNLGPNMSSLYNYGFVSGDTVYFAAYIYGTYSTYADPLSGLGIFTALSSTPAVTSAIVP